MLRNWDEAEFHKLVASVEGLRGADALIAKLSSPNAAVVSAAESELTAEGVPYEIGISRYRELARGQILGDSHGMLKLLVHAGDGTLLGVHAIGTGATELIHIGQAVMAFGGGVDYLVDTVFNYPTLAEGYKVAALDASNKIAALGRLATRA